jgi:hypothetical protein
MKEFLLKLMAEDSNLSMTRFLTLIITIVGLGIAMYGVYKGTDQTTMVGLLLGSGLTAKVTQRFAESKESQ